MIHFSIGYNFDRSFVKELIGLNTKYARRARIDEVFGALAYGPVPSARPQSRLPALSLRAFGEHVRELAAGGISFNYLLNTAWLPQTREARAELRDFVRQLVDAGVRRMTVGTPDLAALVRGGFGELHLTLSITYGTDSAPQIEEVSASGIDALYLDGVTVNRDFALLRELVRSTRCEPRLYANLSCISGCPVVEQHYKLFARQHDRLTERRNDAFFAGCSAVKLSNPVEWLQMPWIRPEDIEVYAAEGVRHFKLADRLAPTPILVQIAQSYLSGASPSDLFTIIERDGAKFSLVADFPPGTRPMRVRADRIPGDFIEHFRSGECKSRDLTCAYCTRVAREAVSVSDGSADLVASQAARWHAPMLLVKRIRDIGSH